jgi:hypothetical protein
MSVQSFQTILLELGASFAERECCHVILSFPNRDIVYVRYHVDISSAVRTANMKLSSAQGGRSINGRPGSSLLSSGRTNLTKKIWDSIHSDPDLLRPGPARKSCSMRDSWKIVNMLERLGVEQ